MAKDRTAFLLILGCFLLGVVGFYRAIPGWDLNYGLRLPVPADPTGVAVEFPSIDIQRITYYQTRRSLADLQAFYRREFEGRGWSCATACDGLQRSIYAPPIEGSIGFQDEQFHFAPFYQVRGVGISVYPPDANGWRRVRVFETIR